MVPAMALAYVSPGKPTGYVSDFAHVLSASDVNALESKLSVLDRTTGSQVAVVTVPTLGGDTVEGYAKDLFQEWRIGGKERDSGLLILVATGDRKVRIEVGYGLEGDVTDLQSGRIVRDVMAPAFAKGDYAGGISGAVDAVSALIIAAHDGSGQPTKAPVQSRFPVNPEIVIFLCIVVLNAAARMLGATRSWWLGGVLGGIAGAIIGAIWGFYPAGIVATPLLIILGLAFDYFVSKKPPSSGGGFWPIFMNMGGGRGGSSGGFGGFGGGRSGGGGASGGW